jgi:hypothetical protein
MTEITQTFDNFCSIGSGQGATWFNPGVHGSCTQRVSAVRQGLIGYQQGLLPGVACPL